LIKWSNRKELSDIASGTDQEDLSPELIDAYAAIASLEEELAEIKKLMKGGEKK